MKITDLTAAYYSRPLNPPITNGLYTYTHAHFVVVEIHTDEGITGVGWTDGSEIVLTAARQMRSYVVGEDPFATERIWHKLYRPKIFGRKGLELRAISAIDIALWDLKGKAVGQPLHKLLGAHRDRIPAYVAGGYYEPGKGLRELAQEMEEYVAQGARAVKMKIGAASFREDEERVRVVRETIGPDVKLMVDANNAYSTADAIRMARRLERYDLFWFEEPVSPDNVPACAEVAAATDIPIAAGENEYTRWGFRDLITARAVDVLNPDAKIMGGVTEWWRVAALASAFDLPVAPHGAQEVHVHLACAAPNGLILEFYNPRANAGPSTDLFDEPLRIVDGDVVAPDRPGLGFNFRREALESIRVA